MDQLRSILHDCVVSVRDGFLTLAAFFVIFSIMERVFTFRPMQKPWRATLLDLQYAFLSMLYPPFIYFVIFAIFGWLAWDLRVARPDAQINWLHFAAQLFVVFFIRDCLIYVRHRIFHLQPVWAFHSIHHSSEEVNWLSAVRFHPAENAIESALEILLFLGWAVLGFHPTALSAAALILAFYNLLIHSNLGWTFGPLRYVFVSPVFHRWHHSDAPEAQDKNFAAMFSCLDLVLGTFYMPKNALPLATGLAQPEKATHPRTLAGQVLYPFRKR